MKNDFLRKKICLVFALGICVILGFSSSGFAKETQKVAVLPFVINAKDDLTFLQKGIFDMFSSRLSYANEVEVLTREDLERQLKAFPGGFSFNQGVNETQAKKLGQFLKVDHVLFGSLTLFGNSMSLDVNMIDIDKEVPALTFFRQAKDAGEVIPELNKIAEEINYKVFGRQTEDFQSQQLMARNIYQNSGDLNRSPLSQYTLLFQTDLPIEGMAVGDTDGDDQEEVAIFYKHTVQILKMGQNGKLIPFSKIELSHALVIVGIDIADINDNGYGEIFVSCINPMRSQVKSSIIEYTGKNYIENSETYPWYFRVVQKRSGPVLFAQKSGKGGPYNSTSVFQVQGNGKSYSELNVLRTPPDFSVMGYAAGDVNSKGQSGQVYTNEQGQLRIFDDSGRVVWSSEEGFGVSLLHFKLKGSSQNSDYRVAYFQPRSLIYDINEDGNQNLIAIRNNNKVTGVIKGFREINYGQLEIMDWSDLGLLQRFQSKKLPGQITDIGIAHNVSVNKKRLLVSFVKKRNKIFSEGASSMIIAYDLKE